MGALSSYSNVLNAAILQSPYMECCRVVNKWQCILNLLGFIQLLLQWAMFFITFVLFVAYFPETEKYDRGTERGEAMTTEWKTTLSATMIVMGYMAVAGLSCVLLITMTGKEQEWISSRVAALFGTISLILSICQFLPQLRKTYLLRRVGALSVSAIGMQAPGSFVFCYTLAVSPGTNVTTWMTYFVGGVLQSILLVMCLYYDRIEQQHEPPQHNYECISNTNNQGFIDSVSGDDRQN